MRLNLQTDYALRMLMYLAGAEKIASVDEIADSYGVSRHHLMKVAQQLAALGYVEARRGRGGGLTLSRPASEMNVGQLVRAIEPTSGLVECFNPASNECRITAACGLQGMLRQALEDFLKRLDRYSVADLVPNRARFAALLADDPGLAAT